MVWDAEDAFWVGGDAPGRSATLRLCDFETFLKAVQSRSRTA